MNDFIIMWTRKDRKENKELMVISGVKRRSNKQNTRTGLKQLKTE